MKTPKLKALLYNYTLYRNRTMKNENVTIEQLLKNWDSAIVDLNRGNGMYKFSRVRLRECDLSYSKPFNTYFVKYGNVTFGIHDIFNLTIKQ